MLTNDVLFMVGWRVINAPDTGQNEIFAENAVEAARLVRELVARHLECKKEEVVILYTIRREL